MLFVIKKHLDQSHKTICLWTQSHRRNKQNKTKIIQKLKTDFYSCGFLEKFYTQNYVISFKLCGTGRYESRQVTVPKKQNVAPKSEDP